MAPREVLLILKPPQLLKNMGFCVHFSLPSVFFLHHTLAHSGFAVQAPQAQQREQLNHGPRLSMWPQHQRPLSSATHGVINWETHGQPPNHLLHRRRKHVPDLRSGPTGKGAFEIKPMSRANCMSPFQIDPCKAHRMAR